MASPARNLGIARRWRSRTPQDSDDETGLPAKRRCESMATQEAEQVLRQINGDPKDVPAQLFGELESLLQKHKFLLG